MVLPAVWLLGIALLVYEWRTGRWSDKRGTYFANGPGELQRTITWLSVEVLILAAVLRPWSYRNAWLRASLALVLFVPWLIINLIIGQHGGSMNAAHVAWLALIVVAVGATTIASVAGAAGLRHPVVLASTGLAWPVLEFQRSLMGTDASIWLSWAAQAFAVFAALLLISELAAIRRARAK